MTESPLIQKTEPIVKAKAILGGRVTVTLMSREPIEFPVEKTQKFAPPEFAEIDCITLLVFDPDKEGRYYTVGVPVEAIMQAIDLVNIQVVDKR